MHLRIFGCKYYVHNNGKDALGKFNPRSDEAIFLGYSSHSKAYKVFNKRTLCVEESVHLLFDESNSLVEKDFLPTHDEGKNHLEGSGTGLVSKEEEQDDKQVGGTAAEPCLEQNPETGSRTILQTGAGASSETGDRTAPE